MKIDTIQNLTTRYRHEIKDDDPGAGTSCDCADSVVHGRPSAAEIRPGFASISETIVIDSVADVVVARVSTTS